MIKLRALLQTYANSAALKTCGQQKKVTNDQVRETNAISQDDTLGLEENAPT